VQAFDVNLRRDGPYSFERESFTEDTIAHLEQGRRIPCAEIQQLVSRSWWQRLWVVQELVLAQQMTMTCGFESLPWQESFVAARVLHYLNTHSGLSTGFPLLYGRSIDTFQRTIRMTNVWSDFTAQDCQGLSLWQLLDYTCIDSWLQ